MEGLPMSFSAGDQVRHPHHGIGGVILDNGPTVVIRFGHGIEECEKKDLKFLPSILRSVEREEWDVPLEVINRAQAEAILSVNDAWGVFSRSRMELLPHQLWVCRQVNATWPARWLVADDVGLGKTIEAGMILWPLLSRGVVKRLLIICPASLVEQWQYRMRTMFDIRLTIYTQEADTKKTDFWGTHNNVIASLHTLRLDHNGRHQRLLESEPWDMLIVDEAHHLNVDEKTGQTLGFRLVKHLSDQRRVYSMVFFTGTPHRGKNFGFLSLIQLLREDLFDPNKSLASQLQSLPEVMIRNNKYNVTDLKGNLLFQEPDVVSETYSYSPAEDRFYNLLTEFIVSGQTYASRLSHQNRRMVVLVLIAMQKLASSSVAAIRRAIKGRLSRIQQGRLRVEELKRQLSDYEEALQDLASMDVLSKLEEQLVEAQTAVILMENEEPRLRELLIAAEAVEEETKTKRILEVVRDRFNGRTILFFTEYKATQSLLMSALMREYGADSVTFINGDERADELLLPDGRARSLYETREDAADKFNSGKVRFLISTEAGGEGIDLQENCHTLIHVDLPWNPMRLHQRVGRLNRYGQTEQVQVLSLRNPDTVESRIWDKLNEKIHWISMALGQVMEQPEDLLQMVLGMASPSLLGELFSEAHLQTSESFTEWFNQKTAQFGGKDVVETVRSLVDNVNRFDFQQISEQLPKVDLPDLRPFMETALELNGRRVREHSGGMTFLTPEEWRNDSGIIAEYQGMIFDRTDRSPEGFKRLLGVGHKVVNRALEQAKNRTVHLATLPSDVLDTSLIVFRVRDRITGEEGFARSLTVGVMLDGEEDPPALLLDWQLLLRLNSLPLRKAVMHQPSPHPINAGEIHVALAKAECALRQRLDELDHGCRHPMWEVLIVLWALPT